MFSSSYLLGGWLVRLVMIVVVARQHRPLHALAWLMPIALFPILGTLLYFWLSQYGLERDTERHREVRRRVSADDRLRAQDRFRSDDIAPEHGDLARLTERISTQRIGGFPLLDGNDVELLTQPGEAEERLIADLDSARETAHLLFYQFANDATGKRVAEALARAAGRGVKCRLLVDAWMSREMRAKLKPWLEERRVEVYPSLPLHPFRQPLARFDVRNHRKVAVIDGAVAYTGSFNIHAPDYQLDDGIWHQISVRITGPAALQLQMVFVEDWYFATDQLLSGEEIFPAPEARGGVTVQTVPEGPSYGADLLQHVFIQAVNDARERIVWTTPYFAPDEPSLLALRLAALRGVRVDLIVPEKSDRRIADEAARAYFQELLDTGVHIHLHQSGIVHAKTVAVDDSLSLVGTANFDRRSLFLNYEVVLLIYDAELTRRLRDAQLRLLEQARPLDAEQWRARPERQKIVEDTIKLLSPVL